MYSIYLRVHGVTWLVYKGHNFKSVLDRISKIRLRGAVTVHYEAENFEDHLISVRQLIRACAKHDERHGSFIGHELEGKEVCEYALETLLGEHFVEEDFEKKYHELGGLDDEKTTRNLT